MSIYSENMMLKAVAMLGKARSLRRTSIHKSLKVLNEAVELMNESIKMEPENIENRKYRLRHLLGVTMNSPKSYIKIVDEDLDFFKTRFDQLNREDRSYYLAALGEYEIYKKNRDTGIKILEDVINNYQETSFHEYVTVYLESLR
ncbi:MAG: hypothetical protein JXR64_02090 [Spirochaetales bacterium]|nr:hypothetical protein [Spirochaetales bacterium]